MIVSFVNNILGIHILWIEIKLGFNYRYKASWVEYFRCFLCRNNGASVIVCATLLVLKRNNDIVRLIMVWRSENLIEYIAGGIQVSFHGPYPILLTNYIFNLHSLTPTLSKKLPLNAKVLLYFLVSEYEWQHTMAYNPLSLLRGSALYYWSMDAYINWIQTEVSTPDYRIIIWHYFNCRFLDGMHMLAHNANVG